MKPTWERSLELRQRIAAQLHRGHIPFRELVSVGGAMTDFLIEGPGGVQIMVQARSWAPSEANTKRPIHQARRSSCRMVSSFQGEDRTILLAQCRNMDKRDEGGIVDFEVGKALYREPGVSADS